jgi:hypothetical protein
VGSAVGMVGGRRRRRVGAESHHDTASRRDELGGTETVGWVNEERGVGTGVSELGLQWGESGGRC